MTPRQKQLARFLHSYQRKNHSPPTMQEMAAELRVASRNAVLCLLRRLEAGGYVERAPRANRNVVLTDAGRRAAAA